MVAITDGQGYNPLMADQYVPNLNVPPPANLSTAQVLTGDSAPTAAQGNDGDEYTVRTTGALYVKANGAWVLNSRTHATLLSLVS